MTGMKLPEINHILENVPGSASVNLMAKVKELKAQGADIIGLAGGEPDFDTPDRIRLKAIQSLTEGRTHYAVGIGLPELREAIARKLRTENKIGVEADQIVVTPGGKYAIYLAIAAITNPGDAVMILNPGWVSYAPLVRMCGAVPTAATLCYEQNYEITEEALEAAWTEKTKAVIVNCPNNPTGKILSEHEADILEAFVKKHNVYLISDEVYERIVYGDAVNVSPGSRSAIADRVITCNGFSKSVAMTGWRLGYLAAPKHLMKVLTVMHSHTVTGCPTFIQDAAVEAFSCGKEIEAMKNRYEIRRDQFIGALKGLPGVDARYPEGAFYAWIRMEKDGMNSFQMADYLLETCGVVGMPGEAYGSGAEHCLRFSFANSDAELADAAERIRRALGA